jgi:hypothetical protein
VIPKITRGGSMGRLLAYLAGPGHNTEHRAAVVVAGDPAVELEALTRDAARELAGELDGPRLAHEAAVLVKGKPAHVWHCSLTLKASEGLQSDERWQQIAEAFVERMGFADSCRWAAVRHGPSKNGNDHVHVVVDLVQENGKAANTWNDRPRAQQACGELEHQFGLEVLESRELGLGPRGATPQHHEIAERMGFPEPGRDYLERIVRACAQLSANEREFVQRVRDTGVQIRPRYAKDSSKRVEGYAVALPPSKDVAPAWYGGGKLARDLTLPRLRERWRSPGAETADQAAHDAAGHLAAWSIRAERTPGPLAAESRRLARFAQTRASSRGLVLGVTAALELRKRVRAAQREAELRQELDEQRQRARSAGRGRDHGIGI